MPVSAYIKLNYKEYFTLDSYLSTKNISKDLYDTLSKITYCFKINRVISENVDREKDYKRNRREIKCMVDEIFENFEKKEELLHKEFRQRYLHLKDILGENAIKITYSDILLKKSFLVQYLNIEYLNTKELPESVKKKLYTILSDKERVEKSMEKKILNTFKHDRIVKQYVVEKDYGRYKIDFYFVDCKVAVEIDEWGHQGYYGDKERQTFIENKLGCVFVRINPFGGDESIEDFLKRLKRTVEYQKRKYQYSFSDDSLEKLDEMARISGCSVDEIIKNIIDDAYTKTVQRSRKQLSVS